MAGQDDTRQDEESSNKEGKNRNKNISNKRRRDTTTGGGQPVKRKMTDNGCKACGLQGHQWKRCWSLFLAMGRGDWISPEVKEKIEQSLEDPTFVKQVEEERKKKNVFKESQS